MPLRSALTLLLAAYLAVVLAPAVPGGPGGATVSQPAERGDCCDPQPGNDDDCCPSGCRHCSRPCCGGSIALAAGPRFPPDWPREEQALAPATAIPCRGADPQQIDHPPRA
jgi:hypothetical protein